MDFSSLQGPPTLRTIGVTFAQVNPTDCVLLLAVLLCSTYIYNRGRLWPRTDPLHYKWFERPQESQSPGNSKSQVTRNIAEKADLANAHCVILWGSQTGTAEALAHRLARDTHQRFKLGVIVGDFADYDPATIASIAESKVLVLVMSTYGEGDPSDNAQHFVSWVTSASDVCLAHLQYAAFGCGNSNYQRFNQVIQDVTSALQLLGAKAILETGKGDEATRSTEEDFMQWKEAFFNVLKHDHNLREYDVGYKPSIDIVEENSPTLQGRDEHVEYAPFSKGMATAFPVTAWREIARYDGQSRKCVDLQLDLSGHPQIKYKTGDHIAVWPVNPAEEVTRLLRILQLSSKGGVVLRIVPRSDNDQSKVPPSTTVWDLFSRHLEICAPVPRETILSLVHLAPSDKVKRELRKLGRDRDTYAKFLEHNHLTLSRLLEMVAHTDPSITWKSLPLPFVVDSLPAMQARIYSISSASITSPRIVSLTVAVKPSVLAGDSGTAIEGLASTYLCRSQVTSLPGHAAPMVHAEIRGSAFKLPVNSSTPLIMVAAGTGIAPFRAFIQERARLASVGHDIGSMVLFFGCQTEANYLYREEFGDIMSSNKPFSDKFRVITAFSRSEERTYVQDQVRAHGQDVVRLLIDNDAAFYICGAASMAKAVDNVVREALRREMQWLDNEVEEWRERRKKWKQWHEDVWS
ncbi:NADPH--cytochrome P450 reductase [Tolypocladium paradoxum]|uniref:NADPH--cytochrome P450 reductase n=1 Tax=Tolypocladium paradoxum TaxID=94208 RepID=A0A2S4KPK5_9HYPO|nr:NADPH--cytochrome P450 reductase [Tolypocladium paradoxum]